MIVHIVCFKYKSDVDEAARARHRERLRALADIDGIIDLKVGADMVRSGRSYDTALLIMFRDRGALENYQKHPRHVPVAQFGPTSCESVVSVDFET
jgi:hypothetical protein